MGYLFENGLSKEGTRGSGGHWWHWLESELHPRLAKSRAFFAYACYIQTHHLNIFKRCMYTELLYFQCLPLCLCSPILIFWWNYPCHNVCAVSEVAGVWCLGPEGWRRDHQRLPPIHLECSRGVKIWNLGGSANRCHVLQNSHSHHTVYILFMALYMLQVAYISVHICKSFPNRGKHQVYTYVCLRHVIYICWFVACFHLSSFYIDD